MPSRNDWLDAMPWLDAIPQGAMGGDGYDAESDEEALPFGPAALSALGAGEEPDGPLFGIPEPSYEAPDLMALPEQSFGESMLMRALQQVPNFMPQRNARGAYPSGLSRVAGVALPILARAAGGAMEGGLKARQAEVNAKNLAATAAAKGRFEASKAGYPAKVNAIATMNAAAMRLAQQKPKDDKKALITEGMLQQYNYDNPGKKVPLRWVGKPIEGSPLADSMPSYDPTASQRTDYGGTGTEGWQGFAEGMLAGQFKPDFNFRSIGPAASRKALDWLAKKGWNQNKAIFKFKAEETFWKQLNSRQMNAIQMQSNTVMQGLEKWEQMAEELESLLPPTSIKKMQGVSLAAARDWGAFGPEIQRKVAKMWTLANDIVPELANVYQMGGVPQEQSLKIAREALNPTAPFNALRGQINMSRTNLGYRINSFSMTKPLTEGDQVPNVYGVTGNVKMVAPDGRELSVPASDVARLEALGAKRR